MTPAGPAFVLVAEYGQHHLRAAVFVYRIPYGIAWVEPGVFDPYPPERPQYRERAGVVTETPDGLLVTTQQGHVRVVDAGLARGTADDHPELQAEFEQLQRRLAAQGTSLTEQRVKLAARLRCLEDDSPVIP